jgi:comEA protein
MLNLTRREKNVIKFLVLLYIAGCIIFFGKKLIFKKEVATSTRDSIVANFQEQANKVDSVYFSEAPLEIDENEDIPLQKVNLNTATAPELLRIKGIGPVTANKIIEYRNNHGKFNSLEELKNVKGIGDKTLEKIKGEVTIE